MLNPNGLPTGAENADNRFSNIGLEMGGVVAAPEKSTFCRHKSGAVLPKTLLSTDVENGGARLAPIFFFEL
jgi:hypothetical protein